MRGLLWPRKDMGLASLYRTAVMQDGPVGYWRLGDSGASAADASGNGATGTYQAAVGDHQRPGLIGGDADRSAMFPGGSGADRCVLVAVSPLKTQGTLSLEAWVSAHDLAGAEGILVRSGQGTDEQYELAITSGGGLLYQHRDAGTVVRNLQTGVAIRPGVTTHCVVTRASDGFTVEFFVNGYSFFSGTVPAPAGPNASQALSIGGTNGSIAKNYYGREDEVALYNYVLSPAQILKHYRIGAGWAGFASPPWWIATALHPAADPITGTRWPPISKGA